MRLAAGPESSRRARRFVSAAACASHCDERVIDDALLLTSEVVTNATTYGDPPIELSVECTGTGMVVTVRDANPILPVQRRTSPEDEGGRGLMLVEAIADTWGVESAGADGKVIWFALTG